METQKLASEILAEVKASAKRWFIAFIIMVVLEIVTIAGFMFYLLNQQHTNVNLKNADGITNYIGKTMNGGIYNGESESNKD